MLSVEKLFDNKADMARKMDIDKRNLQRVINGTNVKKESNSVMGKALQYCVQNGITVNVVLDEFFDQLEAMEQKKPVGNFSR